MPLELNKEQQAAADFLNGICVVVAVPGSGKTLTMTHRIGNLVKKHGIAPENILGLTFTRNAAEAMREKLVPVLDDMASRVQLSTIHSFCHYLLRNEGVTFSVLSGKDQIVFLRDVMKKLRIKDLSIGMVLREISWSKNNLMDVNEFRALYEGDQSMQKVMNHMIGRNPKSLCWILMIFWLKAIDCSTITMKSEKNTEALSVICWLMNSRMSIRFSNRYLKS